MAEEERTALAIVTIDPEGRLSEGLEKHLEALSEWSFSGNFSRWEGCSTWVAQQNPAAALLDLDANWEKALEAAAEITRFSPGTALLGASEKAKEAGGDWLLRAVRSGVRDFVKLPLDEGELREALFRVEQGRGGVRRSSGRVVTLFSAKGGCGLTTLAVNLGIILAKDREKKVALIDLDLEMGDASFLMNLSPSLTVADLADGAHPAGPDDIKRAFLTHVSGAQVLARPQQIAQAERVSEEGVDGVIRAMRTLFDFVLIDAPHNFSPVTLRALDSADAILLVTLPYLSSIMDTKRTVEVFRSLGYEKRLLVVVNRKGRDDDVGTEDIKKALDLPVFISLPEDYREVTKASNRGLSLWECAPRAEITQGLLNLGKMLTLTDEEKPKRKRKFGFF